MSMTNIILIVALVGVIIFIIVTSITGKKAAKKEKEKRYKEVTIKIKNFLIEQEKTKNIRVDFKKVSSRRGNEYKYRDVFDVIVDIVDPKTNKIKAEKAFEVEGFTTKIDKKNFKTDWKVNGTTNLEETLKRVSIYNKEIKLTKEEKKQLKLEEKEKMRIFKLEESKKLKEMKLKEKKKTKKDRNEEADLLVRQNSEKFIPSREKGQ